MTEIASAPVVAPELRTAHIVPSLLAADLSKLGQQLDALKAAGCRWVSVDIMDGHFVPNLSFGPDMVKLAKSRGFFVDAHLMVNEPETMVDWFVKAGADVITFHAEAVKQARVSMTALRASGKLAGLAIKPKTPVETLLGALAMCDLALIMTVEPGFGGQKLLPPMLAKIQAARAVINRDKLECFVQADGGVSAENIGLVAAAGADSLVAGSAVFGAPDCGAAFKDLEAKARASFNPK